MSNYVKMLNNLEKLKKLIKNFLKVLAIFS